MASSKPSVNAGSGASRRVVAPLGEIATWPLVRLHQRVMTGLVFVPCQTCRTNAAGGESLWVAQCAEAEPVGLAFGWAVIAPGVLTIADIMAITTNVLLLDDRGIVPPSLQVAHCARVLHGIPWQTDILRSLQS